MMTPEGKTKAAVKKLLTGYKCYQHWPVMNGMGAPTLDCIGCHNGKFFAVECKAPGKKPTPRQEVTMSDMTLAGADVFVCDGTVPDLLMLRTWLEDNKNVLR